jgi:putative hydrolase of the HAD superfamily
VSERSTEPVTAVLFDLGGTLFSYEGREKMGVANVAALERLGLSNDDPAVRDARRRASEEIEREYATRRTFLHRDLFRDRIVRTAALLGVECPPDVLAIYDDENREAIVAGLVPRPDAKDVLAALRARGLYVGVVSNADDDYLGLTLERHGLHTVLDHWLSSEGADSCKPDHQIFEVALRHAGRTAAETLFVGDSPQHDIAGAAAVGMRTVLIGDPAGIAPLSRGLTAVDADYVVTALTEIVAIVDSLNR